MRPYPSDAIRKVLNKKKAVAIIDQNISLGKGGVLFSELTSELYGQEGAPPILASFIGGLGGRDISQQEFFEIASIMKQAIRDNKVPPPRLLYTEEELKEVRKLQAIAHVERQELKAG